MKAALLSIALGLVAGFIYGDERRRRTYAEGYAADLTKFLHKYPENTAPSQHYPTTWPAPSAIQH